MSVNGGKTMRSMRKGMLLLSLAGLCGLGATSPARQFYASAHQVVGYYRELGKAAPKAGMVERMTLSLLLASDSSARSHCATSS
jgi:hypothetical protein